MIVLLSDFGLAGPYTGQVKAVLAAHAPRTPVIDLFPDLPAWNIRAAASLVAAYTHGFPVATVFLVVVDPGVGDTARRPVALLVDDRWYVGPDNGVFALLARQGEQVQWFEIAWRPARLSNTFHGRDLFAPVAARLAQGERGDLEALAGAATEGADWEDDWPAIVYIDRYGNALTGLRAAGADRGRQLLAGGRLLPHARTFSLMKKGEPFWYENSNGLVEIAVNQGRADDQLGLHIDDRIEWQP